MFITPRSPTIAKGPIPIKIVIVGDGGVGKSSITISLLRRGFFEDYDPTIQDSYSTNITVDGQEYDIEIVDTAGQEEYRGLWGESTVREGDGFILTYAMDSESSFDVLPSFLHTIRKVKSPDEMPTMNASPENTPFPFMVLGNKCDLPPSSRVISAATGLSYARASGGLFYECSAKNRVNIDAAFSSLIRATAKSKSAHEEWLRKFGGDDRGFNGNSAVLERLANQSEQQKESGKKAGEGGWESELEGGDRGYGGGNGEEKRIRKKNPNLAMDRRRSFSVGGLGRHPDSLGKEPGCCASCLIS